jgi:MGT family glycosyltransferase
MPWTTFLANNFGLRSIQFMTAPAARRGSGPALINALPGFQLGRHRSALDCYVGPLVAGMSTGDRDIDWGRLRRPMLVASPGTVFTRPARFFDAVARGFAASEWTVLLATGRTPVSALGLLPDNVLAQQWIPQLEALRYADVLLTHGGINSIHEAMVTGVPMLISPRSAEQRRNAAAVCALGIGAMLDGKGLREQAERLVDDSVGARVAQVRGRALAAGGAARAVRRLLEIADSGVGDFAPPRAAKR